MNNSSQKSGVRSQESGAALRVVGAFGLRALAVLLIIGAVSCLEAPIDDAASDGPLVIGARGRLPGRFSSPRGIDVHPDGRIAVADRTGRIQILSPEGESLVEWRLPDFENGTPTGLIFDTTNSSQTTLLVADTHYNRILRFTLGGELVGQFGKYGETRDDLIYPTDIALDPQGALYVTEYGLYDRVIKFSPEGEKLGEWGGFGTEPGLFQRPLGIVWAPPNRLIVADTCNHRLQIFSDEGELLGVWGGVGTELGRFQYPYDLAIDEDGLIYVCEYGNNRIQRLSSDGAPLGAIGEAGRDPGQFATPWGVAVGADGALVVADTNNHRLQVVRASAQWGMRNEK